MNADLDSTNGQHELVQDDISFYSNNTKENFFKVNNKKMNDEIGLSPKFKRVRQIYIYDSNDEFKKPEGQSE